MNQNVEKFAELIVKNIRDISIRSCDVQLKTTNMNSPIASRWQEARHKNINQFAEAVISDCVDNVIFYFLEAMDNGLLHISIKSENGDLIDLSSLSQGELSGYYMGEWRIKYSKERCFNDLDS